MYAVNRTADKYDISFWGLYFVLTLCSCAFHQQGGDGAPKEEVNIFHVVLCLIHQTLCIITFSFHSEHNVSCIIWWWSVKTTVWSVTNGVVVFSAQLGGLCV